MPNGLDIRVVPFAGRFVIVAGADWWWDLSQKWNRTNVVHMTFGSNESATRYVDMNRKKMEKLYALAVNK
jgi:hypothetical protein